jgi:hypothetical protein
MFVNSSFVILGYNYVPFLTALVFDWKVIADGWKRLAHVWSFCSLRGLVPPAGHSERHLTSQPRPD